jgi:carbonic anhydrase
VQKCHLNRLWRIGEKIQIEESTLRQTTYRHGQAAERIERAKVEQLERKMPAATAKPEQLLISVDGAFIHLTSGEWHEVKTMVVGEFESHWQGKAGELQVNTKDISYYSRV